MQQVSGIVLLLCLQARVISAWQAPRLGASSEQESALVRDNLQLQWLSAHVGNSLHYFPFTSLTLRVVQHPKMQKCWTAPAANGFRTATKLYRVKPVNAPQRRGLQDVAITRTGKPIIRVQGGRLVDQEAYELVPSTDICLGLPWVATQQPSLVRLDFSDGT